MFSKEKDKGNISRNVQSTSHTLSPRHAQCYGSFKISLPCIQQRVVYNNHTKIFFTLLTNSFKFPSQHLLNSLTGRLPHWEPEGPLSFPSLVSSIIPYSVSAYHILLRRKYCLPPLSSPKVWHQPLLLEAEKSSRELKAKAPMPQLSSKAHIGVWTTCLAYVAIENRRKSSRRWRCRGGVEIEAELLPSPPYYTRL